MIEEEAQKAAKEIVAPYASALLIGSDKHDLTESIAQALASQDAQLDRMNHVVLAANVLRAILGNELAEIKRDQESGMRGGKDTPRTQAIKSAVAEYDRAMTALYAAGKSSALSPKENGE
jgi:hypothetical protein